MILGFIVGVFVGAVVGVTVAGLMNAASLGDDEDNEE